MKGMKAWTRMALGGLALAVSASGGAAGADQAFDDLRIRIEAQGLVPGPHAQHLHGALGAHHFQCATMRDDTDGDGWLTNEEASGEYGDVFMALTTSGAVSATSGLIAALPGLTRLRASAV